MAVGILRRGLATLLLDESDQFNDETDYREANYEEEDEPDDVAQYISDEACRALGVRSLRCW